MASRKLFYVEIILIAIVEVLAGLAVWEPVQNRDPRRAVLQLQAPASSHF